MCRKHKNHKWKECPDNPRNKKKIGEVSSIETPATKAKPQKEKKSFVRFKEDEKEADSDDESVESDKKSLGELWEISKTFKADDEELHPVTVITVIDKNGERLAASILVDQCCTGNGIICWDLAEELGFDMTEVAEPQKYKTTGGEFESKFEISVQDAILPCLSRPTAPSVPIFTCCRKSKRTNMPSSWVKGPCASLGSTQIF
jgi:hypothetical protein